MFYLYSNSGVYAGRVWNTANPWWVLLNHPAVKLFTSYKEAYEELQWQVRCGMDWADQLCVGKVLSTDKVTSRQFIED